MFCVEVSESMTVLRVADLFCGCGGFSLGFEWAGFRIVYGLDVWDVACESFSMNFPRAEVVCANALTLNPDSIPDVDVIIGGPPCQSFSCANRTRKTDKGMKAGFEGEKLIKWFWEVVKTKKPKWVVMEEVPTAAPVVCKYVPRGCRVRILRACDYGVPQLRRRLFAGIFPDPPRAPVEPVFPTVVATEYKGRGGRMSRLSDLLGRKSLLPEAMLVQTFPLDYMLAGKPEDRFKQVGNAVPPMMAYRIALAIRFAEEKQVNLSSVIF